MQAVQALTTSIKYFVTPSHKYQGDVSKKMCKVELLFCSERDNFIFDFPLNDAVAFFLKHYLL